MKTFIALLFIISLAFTVEAAESHPHYNLFVSFDIQRNSIKGTSTITLTENKEYNVFIGKLRITSVILNGKPFMSDIKKGVLKVTGKGILEITYEGIFKEEDIKQERENKGVISGNVIDEKGICLTEGWYPSIQGIVYYNLIAIVPNSFTAISEADEVIAVNKIQGKEYSFKFPHPLNSINLVAGRYMELKEIFNDIEICGYFFPEDISLAKTYIEYAKKYIKMYEELLAPYPYKRFSVVEDFLPTGYSMPTFTLLGQEVVKLPFIVETSLGHEILHQWFGNSVYIDHKKGNWAEGLTTYLSDHLYEEQKGKGWQYRKKILTDYESYVSPEKEFPLRDFISREDFASKAVGYGKGAMVFHMLRNLTGDDLFYKALRSFIHQNKFKEASWDDLRTAFEKESGKNLEQFFNQWLNRKGLISIEIKNPRVIVLKGIPAVSFEIIQKGEIYEFNLPLKIKTDKGEINTILNIKNAVEKLEISVEGNPLEVVIDENYDLMRQLSEEESPPLISKLLGDEKRLVVIPEKDRDKYEGLINILKKEGFILKEEREIKDKDLMSSSLLVLGIDSPILKRLFAGHNKVGHGFMLMIKKNPLNTFRVIAIAYGDSKNEVDLASEKIFHYGKYSFIRFENGKIVEKKTDETASGINVSLYEPVWGIQPQKAISLEDIINTISDKPVIYIGEIHTNYEDHKLHLKIIMGLYEKGRKFAIGMEMFQKPFQKVIDEYLSGAISERELLKKTEYFKRWKFDYNFYREILEFAKAKNIPVVALNLRSEIVEKVSREGLDVLNDENRNEIPEDMDMSDEDYRKRLRDIFEEHKSQEIKNFDYFYQSQILWDETMSHSIDKFLKENPAWQMVVLAGAGHIIYGSGIPKRVYRLNAKDYVTIIPDKEILKKDVGDFLVFLQPISLPYTPKLGVFLKEGEGKVIIDKLSAESAAEKSGLKEGDIFISIDNCVIENIEDVKISLFDKKQGETVKIKILRKRFLAGEKEIEVIVTF
ncbi:MAG: ChaN family lipoprotein [Nitrospirota bacterium]